VGAIDLKHAIPIEYAIDAGIAFASQSDADQRGKGMRRTVAKSRTNLTLVNRWSNATDDAVGGEEGVHDAAEYRVV
jgi:hypothetical protein